MASSGIAVDDERRRRRGRRLGRSIALEALDAHAADCDLKVREVLDGAA